MSDTIKVRFTGIGASLARSYTDLCLNPWLRFFPNRTPTWGKCEFIFNDDDYDWLVAYDDLPGPTQLKCAPQNTLLVTCEPSSIKAYGNDFLKQFGYILTGQEDWALSHPGKIYSQPALHWYYGDTGLANNEGMKDYDAISNHPPLLKKNTLSTVCSAKQQKHTVHYQRFQFIERLQTDLLELQRFGKGVREVIDKAETLDDFKYHIAIENHISDHWWTEKLSDSFLGHTLPFYYGAPNAESYFPKESFIPINIKNYDEALRTIQTAILNNEYEKRIDAITEARRRVLEEYGLFATISKIIEARHSPTPSETFNTQLESRHSIRKNPIIAIRAGLEKAKLRGLSTLHNH